ncbi:MAG: phage baseplate assembly protein V [Deltaproteobacteria bacterium]|nr:phage baseplate assembly protein V [Deltaproteobacteria bacterium]
MSDPVSIIRAIVRDELKSLRLGDLAIVTSVFPHAEGDENNYECSVKLREGDLELRRVPMATPHMGMVSVPNVGDLVLLSYVGADPNRPIVVGRLYSDKANPPEHDENEWRLKYPFEGETEIAIDKEEAIVLTAGKTVVTVEKDGAVQITGETDLQIEVKGNVDLKCSDCKIDASGNVELGSGGAGVITEDSHKCFFTGAPLMGSKSVKAKG